MENRSTKAIIIAAALTMLTDFPVYSSSIEEFQTEEYYGSGGLDLIYAAEAYSKGYTGKGVTIGFNDEPVNFEHESFSEKTGSKYVGSFDLKGIDWEIYEHGTHSAAIIAGSKNGKTMHGIAFEADIINTLYFSDDSGFSSYQSYPQIRNINNSWGLDCNVDEFFSPEAVEDGLDYKDVFEKLTKEINTWGIYESLSALSEANSKDWLLIFSNGNEGQPPIGFVPFYHWLNNKSINNFITVTTVLNSCGENTHLERNSDGSITGDFIAAPFSNLAKYYEDSIIAVPGWNILSSNSVDKNSYIVNSGTSSSSPYVTGGAALVQQAFPYMNAKQIGDVLLSTANTNINTEHPFSVTSTRSPRYDDQLNPIYDNEGNLVFDYFATLYYQDGRTESSDEVIINDLLTYAESVKNDDRHGKFYDEFIKNALDEGKVSVYYQVPLQEFVGQGILDVGKAVSGPGALNARRLEKENISEKYLTDGQKTVMYEIDTKGYDSVWSNDIKEIRVGKLANNNTEEDLKERYNYYDLNWLSNSNAYKWSKVLTKAYVDEFNNRVEKSGLEGLHVGLLKSGKGILKLEGNNTYKGATVVTDGAIAVNGSVAGDAYSEKDGIIMGKGKINGTLYNNNIAIAGDGGVGDLTMGALESKGQLISSINNGESSKFVVDGKANIDGSTLVVAGLLPGESCTVLKADSITGELANNQENTTGTTAFLKEYAKIENNEVKYVYDLSPNFEGVSAKQAKAFDAIKRMYFKLMSEYESEPENASSRGSVFRAATTPQQMAQIMTFINLPAAQAGPALNAVTLNAAAQSMTLVQRNSMTGDILSSHFGDRFREESKTPFGTSCHFPHLRGGRSLRCAPTNGGAGDEATTISRSAPSLAGGAVTNVTEGVLSNQADKDWIATASTKPRNDDNNSCVSNTLSLNKISSSSVTTPTCQSQATSATRSHPVARLHAAILGGSPQGEALEQPSTTPRCVPTNGERAGEQSETEGGLNDESPRPLSALRATSPNSYALGADHNLFNCGAWFKFVYNKGEMRDGARYHGRSGIIGYDLKLTDTKSFGLFFGHGNNTLDGFDSVWAKNKIEENKFGFYSYSKNNKSTSYLYLDYGKVDNELRRNLTNLGLSTNVKYKGNLFEIGGEYKLIPKSQKNKTWKVYPYINLQFSKYKQDGFHESDGGIFNHVIDSKTNNYVAGQLGLEFNFSNEKENYVLRLAGKTAFSGNEPKLTYSFEGDMANKYELDNEQDKNHLLVSFKGERKVSINTLLSADFSMQRGSHDRDIKASLSFWRRF